MEPFARNSKGRKLIIVSIDPPFSNFKFYEGGFPLGFQKPETFRRICSQVRRLGGRTMVIEELEPSCDIEEENSDLRHLHPDLLPGITRRISFFKKPIKNEKDLSRLTSQIALGYVILKEEYLSTDPIIFTTRIFESVLTHPQRINNFIRGAKEWFFKVGPKTFSVEGYLYAQQNGETNCCAHVALRCVAAAFHPQGDMTYAEMNQILGIDHKKTFAWNGLSLKQQIKVLTAAGAKCISANFAFTPKRRKRKISIDPPSFQKYIYSSIESGYPSIVTFKTQRSAHAVPIFGHTFNQDTWVPLAEGSYFSTGGETRYIPSDSWLSMFIGHDDNFGSNICIPNHYLLRFDPRKYRKGIAPKQVAYVIATIPNSVKVEPIFAELVGAHYLWHISKNVPDDNPWTSRLRSSVEDPKNPKNNRIVLRTRLIHGDDYCDHLAAIRGWNNRDRIADNLLSPIRSYLGSEWVWIVEFSLLEVFAGNLRKLGEIVVRADKKLSFRKTDLEGFLLARVPSYFVTIERKNGQLTRIPSGIADHVKLLDC